MPRCRFCTDGKRYRVRGHRRIWMWCPTCGGTGNEQPPLETFRETRRRREAQAREEEARTETTRAATKDGPTREHGDPDKGEEELEPHRGAAHVTRNGNAPSTQKET